MKNSVKILAGCQGERIPALAVEQGPEGCDLERLTLRLEKMFSG